MKKLVRVSDHAIVRWLERVRGVDIEAFRAEIVATVQAAVDAGAKQISVGGVTYILDGAVVTTVSPNASPTSTRINGIRANGVTPKRGDVGRADFHRAIRRGRAHA